MVLKDGDTLVLREGEKLSCKEIPNLTSIPQQGRRLGDAILGNRQKIRPPKSCVETCVSREFSVAVRRCVTS